MPNSSWRVVLVTIISFYVCHQHAHPIGKPLFDSDDDVDEGDDMECDDQLDGHHENSSMSSTASETASSSTTTRCTGTKLSGVIRVPTKSNSLWVFYCLALAKEEHPTGEKENNQIALNFCKEWWWGTCNSKEFPGHMFQGVHMDDLYTVEDFFNVSFVVYRLKTYNGNQRAILVRRPPLKRDTVSNVHMPYEGHVDYIISKYAASFKCNKCGQLWKRANNCHRHMWQSLSIQICRWALQTQSSFLRYIAGVRYFGCWERSVLWIPRDIRPRSMLNKTPPWWKIYFNTSSHVSLTCFQCTRVWRPIRYRVKWQHIGYVFADATKAGRNVWWSLPFNQGSDETIPRETTETRVSIYQGIGGHSEWR